MSSAYDCVLCRACVHDTRDVTAQRLRVCTPCLPAVRACMLTPAFDSGEEDDACEVCDNADATVRIKVLGDGALQALCYTCAHLCGTCASGEVACRLGTSVFGQDEEALACVPCRFDDKATAMTEASSRVTRAKLRAADAYACGECGTHVRATDVCARRARQIGACQACYTRAFATTLGGACSVLRMVRDTRMQRASHVVVCACTVCSLPRKKWRMCSHCCTEDPSCQRVDGEWHCYACRHACDKCGHVALVRGLCACTPSQAHVF
jgi:hypothetical protein